MSLKFLIKKYTQQNEIKKAQKYLEGGTFITDTLYATWSISRINTSVLFLVIKKYLIAIKFGGI